LANRLTGRQTSWFAEHPRRGCPDGLSAEMVASMDCRNAPGNHEHIRGDDIGPITIAMCLFLHGKRSLMHVARPDGWFYRQSTAEDTTPW
jgi:hypothetical protein